MLRLIRLTRLIFTPRINEPIWNFWPMAPFTCLLMSSYHMVFQSALEVLATLATTWDTKPKLRQDNFLPLTASYLKGCCIPGCPLVLSTCTSSPPPLPTNSPPLLLQPNQPPWPMAQTNPPPLIWPKQASSQVPLHPFPSTSALKARAGYLV